MEVIRRLVICFFIIIDITQACWMRPSRSRCCDDIQTGFCFRRKEFSNDPVCPSSYSPIFTLFTREMVIGARIHKDKVPFHFSNNRSTVFVVHGWQGSFSGGYVRMKNELLRKDDLNVIAVDWRKGASSIIYLPAAANTQSIGALMGSLVNSLRKVPGSNPHFWCIGHSLGSHVCGFSSLTALPLLDRITGVDPAGPSFRRDQGLTRNSALHVDIIHTDPLFGSLHPRGHVDFYPSGGKNQPGCVFAAAIRSGRDSNSISDEQRIVAMQQSYTERGDIGCSHQRAQQYMINSITYDSCYIAKQVCADYDNIPGSCQPIPSTEKHGMMGYYASKFRYSGYLYLEPGHNSPYCVPKRS